MFSLLRFHNGFWKEYRPCGESAARLTYFCEDIFTNFRSIVKWPAGVCWIVADQSCLFLQNQRRINCPQFFRHHSNRHTQGILGL